MRGLLVPDPDNLATALLHGSLLAILAFASLVTLLSQVRHPHWMFRIWDFPRVQIAGTALVAAALYVWLFFADSAPEKAFLIATGVAIVWQVWKIWPYTPFAFKQVKRAEESEKRPESMVSLMVSNVLMENEDHQAFLDTVDREKPDLVLAVEVNGRWAKATECLREAYPHVVSQPQENYYGMILFSKLPLIDPKVRYLVQDDIPSVHTGVELRSGEVVCLHCVHPRPPEPIRDQKSTPRDAELTLLGRTIGDEQDRPTMVAGDLNDVAWSHTSQMFLRLSGLLDPRVGRGFYNSYNANYRLCRFPLDHVFHSNDFKLVDLQRLAPIGSDHFPILIQLLYEPAAEAEQPEPKKASTDDKEAEENLQQQAEAAATGDDRPSE